MFMTKRDKEYKKMIDDLNKQDGDGGLGGFIWMWDGEHATAFFVITSMVLPVVLGAFALVLFGP